MRRILMIAAAVLSLQYPSAVKADAASEIAAIKAAMDSLGQAFLAEDGTAIKSLMTPDHIAIGPVYDGPVSIDEQIAMFPRIVLSERVPTDKQVTLLSDTVAIGNFGMTLRGTLDGKPLHERAYSTEIWVKRDGKWLQKLYQETAIGEH